MCYWALTRGRTRALQSGNTLPSELGPLPTDCGAPLFTDVAFKVNSSNIRVRSHCGPTHGAEMTVQRPRIPPPPPASGRERRQALPKPLLRGRRGGQCCGAGPTVNLTQSREDRAVQAPGAWGSCRCPPPAPQTNHSTATSEGSFISSYKNPGPVLSTHLQKQYIKNSTNNIKHAHSTNVQRLLCTIDGPGPGQVPGKGAGRPRRPRSPNCP